MQQKYLWGAAAVVVLGAIAAYVGVDYAYHHPASILAKFGEAATFGGLNPNPLSDVSALLSGKGVRRPVIEARINHPANSTVPIVSSGTEEETIEPIQVEAIPFATAEPPTSAEESEEQNGNYIRGEYHLWVQPKAVTPDEDQDEDAKPCEACPVMKMLRGLGNMCWGLSNTGLWEAVEDWGSKGGCSGCLEWYEYSTPERIPVMPTPIPENEDEPDSTEAASPGRITDIVQLFSASADDMVAAVQKYLSDLAQVRQARPGQLPKDAEEENLEYFQHEFVIVAEPNTNKVILNVSRANYEGFVSIIHEIDKAFGTDQCNKDGKSECYHGCGQRCGTQCCPKKPETTDQWEGRAYKQGGSVKVPLKSVKDYNGPADNIDDMVTFNGAQAVGTESIRSNGADVLVFNGQTWQQLQGDWAKFLAGQPSHLTPDRVDGCIAPRTPGIDDEEKVEKPLCQGCCKDGAKLCNPAVGSGRKISVAFDNVPLCNCIDAFTGCPGENKIVVDDQAIQAARIKMDQLITVYFADLDLKTAIEVVLKQTGLKCVFDKNVITITTEEQAK
jgi:hypothetical protein